LRSPSSSTSPFRKGHPPKKKTIVAKPALTQRSPGKLSASSTLDEWSQGDRRDGKDERNPESSLEILRHLPMMAGVVVLCVVVTAVSVRAVTVSRVALMVVLHEFS